MKKLVLLLFLLPTITIAYNYDENETSPAERPSTPVDQISFSSAEQRTPPTAPYKKIINHRNTATNVNEVQEPLERPTINLYEMARSAGAYPNEIPILGRLALQTACLTYNIHHPQERPIQIIAQHELNNESIITTKIPEECNFSTFFILIKKEMRNIYTEYQRSQQTHALQ